MVLSHFPLGLQSPGTNWPEQTAESEGCLEPADPESRADENRSRKPSEVSDCWLHCLGGEPASPGACPSQSSQACPASFLTLGFLFFFLTLGSPPCCWHLEQAFPCLSLIMFKISILPRLCDWGWGKPTITFLFVFPAFYGMCLSVFPIA